MRETTSADIDLYQENSYIQYTDFWPRQAYYSLEAISKLKTI